MKRHEQFAVIGEGDKHVAVRINTSLNAATIHQALMALEELAFVSIPVVYESSNTLEFGFVAADPRASPEEIVKRQLRNRANVLPTDVEPHAPEFGLTDRRIEPGLIDIDGPRSKDLTDYVQ
jgi:hypothetical protein